MIATCLGVGRDSHWERLNFRAAFRSILSDDVLGYSLLGQEMVGSLYMAFGELRPGKTSGFNACRFPVDTRSKCKKNDASVNVTCRNCWSGEAQ